MIRKCVNKVEKCYLMRRNIFSSKVNLTKQSSSISYCGCFGGLTCKKNELDCFEFNFLSSDICFGLHLLSFLHQRLSKDHEGRIFPIKCFYKEVNNLKRNTSFSLRCCRFICFVPFTLGNEFTFGPVF